MTMQKELKVKAVAALNELSVMPRIIKEFENEGILNYSDGKMSTLLWLNDEMKKQVEKIEADGNKMVYHAVVSHVTDGVENFTFTSYLYVSSEDYPALQVCDPDRRMYYACSYVTGLHDEYGDVVVHPNFGGLKRYFG